MTDHDTVLVRYIVDDVDAAIDCYTTHLGFDVVMHPAPSFGLLARGALRLALSAPNGPGGGSQPMPTDADLNRVGWNRISLPVEDLEADVDRPRTAGVPFRDDIVTGVGGKQILIEDPAGNPIELFQPVR